MTVLLAAEWVVVRATDGGWALTGWGFFFALVIAAVAASR